MTKSKSPVKRLNTNKPKDTKNKRIRHEITPAMKHEIHQFQKLNPGLKQADLIGIFSKQFKFDISSSTMSDILKQKTKDKINKLEDIDNDFNFRIRDGKYHALEECVFEWIMLMNRSNVPINDDLIQAKAKEFAEYFKPIYDDIDKCSFSIGWLAGFKKRFKVSRQTIIGESGSVDKDLIEALFYQLPPNKTIASKKTRLEGTKLSKKRLSVAFCVNASGKHPEKPIVIGYNKKPHDFPNNWWWKKYCHYAYNKNAWMTMEIWETWLLDFNQRMKEQKRNVILLVDNAGGHNMSHKLVELLTNVKVYFLPPNTTSVIQPMDQGIIAAFKCYYRKLIILDMLNQIEEKEKYEQIKTKQSILFIYEAWHKVREETIKNCWRHSGILNQLKTTETTEKIVQHKTIEEIKIHLSKFKTGFEPIYTADEFIHIDDFEDTCKELTELDLINRYTKPYIEEEGSYDEDDLENALQHIEIEEKLISIKEAQISLNNVWQCIEQHSSMNEEHLASLFNIKFLLDDLKEENTIQPKIDKYFSKK